VEDAEEVLRVLVDLGALALREHVLDVERVPAEALGEPGRGIGFWVVEMDPGEPARGELERAALRDCRLDSANGRPRAPDPGQAGHPP
jgi:hypothetical protein